ncbi:MAG TPA: DUF3108 domain-containing protein [Casimicrobiaceae bacterium]|nr:DUF3108 domain-containing protein [Casimicrobiaceae bacterium]
MNTTTAPSSPATTGPWTARLKAQRPRRGLVVALALSLALHGALSLWPAELPAAPDESPLQATIKEMPPPPLPAPVAAAKPRPKPRRATVPPAPAAPEAPPAPEHEAPPVDPTPDAIAMGPEPAAEALPAEPTNPGAEAPPPELPKKTLPPRIDLVYKAFLGTHGFVIGEATYRFEHAANEYRIVTIGEAKGIAALFIRGQGKVESRGIITSEGLQPQEFSIERGSKERHETAVFDWEAGILTLHDHRAEPLELPTFDPLALMWQAYFSPPVDDTQTVSVATTRKLGRYSITREGIELIKWPQGEIETERWHRRSEDGKTDGYVWIAPSLHYVPVKMRITATNRGTLEALLDSIRVDEATSEQ